MRKELWLAIRELQRCARLQVKHHGHCCGYGCVKGDECRICIPTVKAVQDVDALLEQTAVVSKHKPFHGG